MDESEQEIALEDKEGAEDNPVASSEDECEEGKHPEEDEDDGMGAKAAKVSKATHGTTGGAVKEDGIGPHEHKWKPYYIIHIGSGKKKGDVADNSGIFECEECPFIAPTAKDIARHKTKEHKEKPRVACDECGKDFARKYELQAHVRTIHLGIRDAHCPHCDYVASEKGRVKKHVQTVHMNIRGYKCPHCKYAAKNKSGLDNHVNAIHLKLKKYKCPHCDYSAVQSGQIQVHGFLLSRAASKILRFLLSTLFFSGNLLSQCFRPM